MNKRFIKTRSIHNIRDLGGLITKDNKTIKRSILLRSGALNKVSKNDINYLINKYNLKHVVDLRTNQEKAEKEDIRLNDLDYVHYPVLPNAMLGITREEKLNIKDYVYKLPDMNNMYEYIVDDDICVKNMSKALKKVVNNRDGSILWHCSAGKDRCGMLAAFVLYILNVDEKVIEEDYLLSNIDAKKEARKYYFLVFLVSRDLKICRQVYDLFIADISYYRSAINKIKEKNDTVLNYIINVLGISEKEIEDFKNYVLD